jgi:polyhydroxyalkanoate synthesis regulator phasin
MNRRRWLATGAAGLAAVLGGGAALAASGSSDPPSDFIGDVAQRLGISKDKLENAIDDATIARIDAAVADGKLTKEQGEELKKRVRSGDGPVILPGFRGPDFCGPELGIGPPGIGPHEKGFFGGFDLMQKAADYLGVDAADLRKELSDGKSLADVAKDKGKSVNGLKQSLRDSIRGSADKAVEDGKLTKEQADRIVKGLSAGVDDLVEGGRFEFHFRTGPGRLPPPGDASFAPA